MDWCEPMDPVDPTHVEASLTNLEFRGGWFAHPIFVDGNYPLVMRDKVVSKIQ